MDVDKKARFLRIGGFICLGAALLDATFAVLAMVADKKVSSGGASLAIAACVGIMGVNCLRRGKRRPPPYA